MQPVLLGVLSLALSVTLIIFFLPVFLILAGITLVIGLFSVVLGRGSIRVIKIKPASYDRPVNNDNIIDITDDQKKDGL